MLISLGFLKWPALNWPWKRYQHRYDHYTWYRRFCLRPRLVNVNGVGHVAWLCYVEEQYRLESYSNHPWFLIFHNMNRWVTGDRRMPDG